MALTRCLFAAIVGGLAAVSQLQAQGTTGTITGRVVDSTSQQPLASVTVQVEGTQRGALSRADGTYSLVDIPAGAQRVRVARIGYTPQTREVTVTAGGSVTLDFAISAAALNLSSVVVVGYGTQRREAVTGAVATVDATEANVGVIPNATGLIQGRVAGVNVTLNSGEPGAGAQIRVRGGTSISASNDPLYVIDGVPIQNDQTEATGIGIGGGAALARSPLNLLNPSDIASITVLKDASATAIYGSRGANGVVLIETRKGRSGGGTTLEYEVYGASSSPSSRLDFLTGAEYRQFVQKEIDAGHLPASRLNDLGTANTDWEKELTRTAYTQNHNLSFSGGAQNTTYRASLNYLDQNGVMVANGFKRYQGRLNAFHDALNGKLQIGVNLTSSRVDNDYLPFENTGGFEGGVFANMGNFNPTLPVTVTDPTTNQLSYFETGRGRQSTRNPVALAHQISDVAQTNRTLGNVTSTYRLFSTLSAQVNAGIDRSSGVRQTYLPRSSPVGAEWNGRARQVERDLTNENFQSLLTWTPNIFQNQELEITGGYEYSQFDNGEFGAEAQNFATDAFSFNNLGGGAQLIPPFSWREESRLVSFFSRANYSFHNKYFLTGVVRRDGSSRFGAGNKWAVFPAVSASWRISEESFMQNSFFSDLRLRAGWGKQGNQAVSPYASLILLEPNNGARYPFGDNVVTGVVATRNANPKLKWEETDQYSGAIDYAVANGRFSGTLEYYQKNTSDLLLTVSVPQPAPVSTRLENVGKVRNKGFEASLDGRVLDRGRFTMSSGLVLSVERNEVLDLGGRSFITTASVSGQGQSGQNAQRIIPGQPLGTFYGPEFVGINDQGQQLFNNYKVEGTTRTLDGTTIAPGADDYTIIGDANPAYSIGLRSNITWGKFDGSFLIRSEQGRDVFNNTALVYAAKSNVLTNRNVLSSALNDETGINEPAIFSSRWIEDGSFTRLQNVTVGYSFTLPSTVLRGSSVRAFVSGDNLLLFTPYSGYDPEVYVDAGLASRGIDYLTYPRARTFTAGLALRF